MRMGWLGKQRRGAHIHTHTHTDTHTHTHTSGKTSVSRSLCTKKSQRSFLVFYIFTGDSDEIRIKFSLADLMTALKDAHIPGLSCKH